MTMPHLMNCSHSEDGWCLDCVKILHDEKEKLEQKINTIVKMKYKYALFHFYKTDFISKYLAENPLNVDYYGGWNCICGGRPLGVNSIEEAISIINDEDYSGDFWEIVNLETFKLEKVYSKSFINGKFEVKEIL